jgi:hypothetical protein
MHLGLVTIFYTCYDDTIFQSLVRFLTPGYV